MKITLWGTRGSIGSAGPDTVEYGGDTSAASVEADDGRVLVLDAGSGVRKLGTHLELTSRRVDILLTHLHMDHVQGLGFFGPMFDPDIEVHLWGPGSGTMSLEERLTRYLSPPLFPVRVRDLPNLVLHDTGPGSHEIGPFRVETDLVSHPGTTLGYRISADGAVACYLPDHEPALGSADFPNEPEWTSGFGLARQADVLIHDAQYTDAEYDARTGWGHSSFRHVRAFAELTQVETLVSFHHDPAHSDRMLDEVAGPSLGDGAPYRFVPGRTGTTIEARRGETTRVA